MHLPKINNTINIDIKKPIDILTNINANNDKITNNQTLLNWINKFVGSNKTVPSEIGNIFTSIETKNEEDTTNKTLLDWINIIVGSTTAAPTTTPRDDECAKCGELLNLFYLFFQNYYSTFL